MKKHSITDFYIFAGVLKKTQRANADMTVIGKHMQVIFVQACGGEGGRQGRGATAAARVLDASNEN